MFSGVFGEATGATLASRIFYAYRLWFFGSTVLIILAAAYCAIVLAFEHKRNVLPVLGGSWPVLLSALLLTLALAMSLFAQPAFPQYYMPPIPFAVLLSCRSIVC